MQVTASAYLLLGTNMGDRLAQLSHARNEISTKIGNLHRISSIYETGAWGHEDQPNYLNQVVGVATTLKPLPLLATINAIEKRMGRIRVNKWESRLIDIDILYYADEVIDEPNLQVPHPHLPNRRFALAPLQEIAATFVHPILGKTTDELLDETSDRLAVRLFNPDTYEQDEF
ncbi:2-amino-4-hydroxy-6-hydroxymethyldihydropteridine diphosphokinase [Parapedobacter sp. 10938]|uniref:2-amino-4-hydroxy-6- hydroxymethyldihydropteridine diphosphokinase n=1 Tax=Parapedobacter flavus TaxID=3110225 RepID=UPI002DB5DECD|nr:2-amino-4-hydroxy-6-hydroxymethyldihydropteridine diphosphokinase [Parapedobacter sp. 10938]MEC3881168.1 2-amino-4-hydroxy-6-hydroxymethyldihydropteridine diphosphokinase [Parapedobacter sp. 10938]